MLPRQVIKNAFISVLKGANTNAGQDVYDNNPFAMSPTSRTPYISVYTAHENITVSGQSTFTTTLHIVTNIVVDDPTTPVDDIDVLKEQVIAAIWNNYQQIPQCNITEMDSIISFDPFKSGNATQIIEQTTWTIDYTTYQLTDPTQLPTLTTIDIQLQTANGLDTIEEIILPNA